MKKQKPAMPEPNIKELLKEKARLDFLEANLGYYLEIELKYYLDEEGESVLDGVVFSQYPGQKYKGKTLRKAIDKLMSGKPTRSL